MPADRGVTISAKTGKGLDDLLLRIDSALLLDPIVRRELDVPQDEGGVLASLEAGGIVHTREFHGQEVRLEVSGPASLLGRYRRFWTKIKMTRDLVAGCQLGSGVDSLAGNPPDPGPGRGVIL